MKKALIFGIIAAGAAAAAAVALKAKGKRYICDDDECGDCYDMDCDCDCGCNENICDIPAEKAEESCIANAPDSSVETAEAPDAENDGAADSKI